MHPTISDSSIVRRSLLAATLGAILAACGGSQPGAAPSAGAQPTVLLPASKPGSAAFAKGADISWVTEQEAAGIRFYNRAGVRADLLDILKQQGMDSIRLRVWVNPADGYNNLNDVLVKARRAKAAGMRLMVDFHYSDSWADPGKQTKPAQWAGYTVDGLVTAVANHTRTTLQALANEGIAPEWVQVGNETNNGMLWEEGKASTNMKNYARLVASGYDAAKSVFPQTKVILHISNCHDNDLFKWNVGGVKANGGKFDVIGASVYPNPALGWQLNNQRCQANLNDMVRTYKVPVMVVEVGTPWDDPNAKAILSDLIAKQRAISGGNGLGVLYWEPQAYNGWKGYTLGAFDPSGKPTAAMDAFLE